MVEEAEAVGSSRRWSSGCRRSSTGSRSGSGNGSTAAVAVAVAAEATETLIIAIQDNTGDILVSR